MTKLDEQETELKKLNLPTSAMHAALAALDREREDLLAATAKRAGAPSNRAKRLLTRLREIVATYHKLVGEGVKALASTEAVAEAGEAIRSLLTDSRITLVPDLNHAGVVGAVHFKELGNHVLELHGGVRQLGSRPNRKANEIQEKLIGSGGRIPSLLAVIPRQRRVASKQAR